MHSFFGQALSVLMCNMSMMCENGHAQAAIAICKHIAPHSYFKHQLSQL